MNEISGLYTEQLSIGERMVLMDMRDLPIKKRLAILEQLTAVYLKQGRSFNLYHEMIRKFFGGFHTLGKSSMRVKENLPLASRLIDIVTKAELSEVEPTLIPHEHSKYLFAFIKEFLVAIQGLIKKKEFKGDYRHLQSQLEFLKKLTQKAKEHQDILTMFENTILLIEQSNPLLLESGEVAQPKIEFGSLALTTSLSKMTKKALEGVISNLHLYQEKDFYRIVQHAVKKYGQYVFRDEFKQVGMLPVYITAMMNPSEKMNDCWLDIANYFNHRREEERQNLIFYPLNVTNMDEFYEFYKGYLQQLQEKGILQKQEYALLHFDFLFSTYTYSKKLTQLFVEEASQFLTKLDSQLSSTQAKTLSEALSYEYTFDNVTEAIVKKNNGGRNTPHFTLRVVNGQVEGIWSGTTKEVEAVGSTWHYPKKETVVRVKSVPELFVVKLVKDELVVQLQTILSTAEDLYVPEQLPALLDKFSTRYFEVEIDNVAKEYNNFLNDNHYWSGDISIFNQLVQYRIQQERLTEQEVQILFGSDAYIEGINLSKVQSNKVLPYLQQAVNNGIVNLTVPSDLHRVYQLFVRIDNSPMIRSYLFEQLRSYYPEKVACVEWAVEKKDGENSEEFQARKEQVCLKFFQESLKLIGFTKQKFEF